MHLLGIGKMKNLERTMDVEEAIECAITCYQFLNLSYTVSEIKAKGDLSTYTVEIDDGIIQGNGKGIGKQSLASALFEGLEHYIYRHSGREDFYEKICNLGYEKRGLEYPLKYLAKEVDGETPIAVNRFVGSNGADFLYPTILWNVYSENNWKNADLYPLYKYMTNSGCAIGLTKDEAELHAINEIIERTSLSVHYRNCFLEAKRARVITINSLPERLKTIYMTMKSEMNAEITIVRVDSAVEGVACYLVYAKREGNIPLKGSGASISEEYACERALLECLQCFHLQCDETDVEDAIAIKAFEKWPLYKRILFLEYKQYENIDFPKAEMNQIKTFQEVLKAEKRIIQKAGIEIYNKCLFSYTKIYCVQVIMPKFTDKFYLVGDGIPVIPKEVGE